ncbi:ABC transporter substrate-binding protein [Actinomadura luteofluorescens]|uniref:ABC transporter substrate-binding protein n=1 Tax=Actinomadura luteofluorescens TaxID=46163 RepID=UPI0036274634
MAIGVVTLAAACGDDDGKSGGTPDGKAVTVQAANGAVNVPAKPKRIVSLSPTHTETLFAIGATAGGRGGRLLQLSGRHPAHEAVGLQAERRGDHHPQAGPRRAVRRHGRHRQVAGEGEGPGPAGAAAKNLDEAYDEIGDLGKATGHEAEAKKVTDGMRADIQKTVAASSKAKGLTYYHELDNQLHSVTSQTFAGQVYGLFGLQNIADKADKASGGYPQLSREYLLKQDPDLIFLADTKCCGQNAAALTKRPGWSDLDAVGHDGVVELDDDIASRWGPRLTEFVKAIGDAVQKVQ